MALPITYRRYVDDSHDRFYNKRKSEKFLNILNSIEPKIQFTAEYEDAEKTLNFLDTSIINNGEGKYEFRIHRKDAITNVQLKPQSCHADTIKYGVFKGFLHRAKAICSQNHLQDEIEFLISVFIENGYNEQILRKIVTNAQSNTIKSKKDTKTFVSLPYVPDLSKKLRNVFEKAGFITMFKSGRNLTSILTSRNKPKLPPNSYPGVYKVPCKCTGNYIGHTGKQVQTRGNEHKKAVFLGHWDESGLSELTKNAH